ncbi:MAG TPA: DNA polymerase, partial [Acidimicrobiales bacterium]|nr:DNA polymerase [Acidimicrobiales bacterium]
MPTIMLLDGNSLAYRAFFALPTDMATASGQVTNAVFGFTSMLIYLLREHHPDRLAVAFDRPEPTFRHSLVSDYKAGRAETPDILRQQMGLVRQVVETMHIPLLELASYEADDIIATLATQARDRGEDVIVVTGDRDAYQLVEDPHVRVLYNKRGVSEYALYDEAGIKERTGVVPALYPQYAAMRGDPSDNLPGVPGVGEKTAAKLINDYGSLDGVFANVDKCTPKLRESLIAHEAQVRSNALATPLVRDVPLDVDVDDLTFGGWDNDELHKLFKFLEFRTLWDRLNEAVGTVATTSAPAAGERLEVEVVRVEDGDTLAKIVGGLTEFAVAAAWEGAAGRSPLVGLALATGAAAYWVPIALLDEGTELIAGLVGPGGPSLHAHDAKELMRALTPRGIDVHSLDVDTKVAAYLLDPAESQYLLEDLALRYLGMEVRSPDAAPAGQLDLSGTAQDPADQAGRQAAAVAALAPFLGEALTARNLRRLYDDVERPLVRVLARMEALGVRVDVVELKRLADSLAVEGAELERRIQELAGEPFKVNSTPQLRHILFEKLDLAPQKKTKTGFSTDAAS